MISQLYKKAKSALSSILQKNLKTFEEWLENRRQRLLENLRKESHLLGDQSWGNEEEFNNFLQKCSDNKNHENCFNDACNAHTLNGLKIEPNHLPNILLRYCVSKKMVEILIDRLIDDPNWKDLFSKGMITWDVVFNEIALNWDHNKIKDIDKLSRGDAVFATFESSYSAIPRNDPFTIAEALALPILVKKIVNEVILFELSYLTNSVLNHRFPTIADAGWIELFNPALEEPPDEKKYKTLYGWTQPLNPKLPPQPEIVHSNESLKILEYPPRFIGRI